MKKIFFVFLILINSFMRSTEVSIGPVEFKENVTSICKKQCKRQGANWTGKLTCNYQDLSKQNLCKCSCK